MPDWLATIAGLNPVSVTITGMRALVLNGWRAADLWPAVATVTGFALVAIVVPSRPSTARLNQSRRCLGRQQSGRGLVPPPSLPMTWRP